MELAVGAITDFFDALGIGSFATTTSVFRLRRMVPDELIPGTLNVGDAPAAIAEALIFVASVSVDSGAAGGDDGRCGAGRLARRRRRRSLVA